jgi:hypothetical protein
MYISYVHGMICLSNLVHVSLILVVPPALMVSQGKQLGHGSGAGHSCVLGQDLHHPRRVSMKAKRKVGERMKKSARLIISNPKLEGQLHGYLESSGD